MESNPLAPILSCAMEPVQFFSALQSNCRHLSVGLLSYNSKSTLILLDGRKNLDGKPNLTIVFFFDPVVLGSNCYRTRAKRLINESNTTGWMRKNWTGKNDSRCCANTWTNNIPWTWRNALCLVSITVKSVQISACSCPCDFPTTGFLTCGPFTPNSPTSFQVYV